MRVGFTGTRQGMSNDQVLQVHMLLGDLRGKGATQASHGMCVGADDQFHFMAKALGYFMIGCPGVTTDWTPAYRATMECDLVMPEKPYLARNRDIIRESDVLIATPKEQTEQTRSGTWATIRYAREAKKALVILYPDGSSTVEQVPGMPITVEEYRQQLVEAQ